jgi:hypothetical protein
MVSIVYGIETGLDALILHGEDGRVVDLAEVKENLSGLELEGLLRSLYPSIPEWIFKDMTPLVEGNIEHSRMIRASNR